MTQIIDPHLHLFDLNRGDYQWLRQSNPPYWPDKQLIHKDFTPSDLVLSPTQTLFGFVHIEAGFDNEQSWQEIAWLESAFGDNHVQKLRTIACADLTLEPAKFGEQLNRLLTFSSVVGVRHILDQDAVEVLTSQFVESNLNLLSEHNLIFELQMPFTDKSAVDLVSSKLNELSNLPVIINHAGFPPVALSGDSSNEAQYKVWRNSLSLLAQLPNVFIKCSGWELGARQYTAQQVAEVVHEVTRVFGEEKVMLASNFPLSLFTRSYDELWQLYQDQLDLNDLQFERLAYRNAKRIYRFG